MNTTDHTAGHTAEPLVAADDVRTHFGPVRAVDGVTLRLADGGTLGLVGESGSGKTTLARTLLGLTPASSGSVRTAGVAVRGAGRAARKALHRDAQMIYQDPHASLSPRLRVRSLLTEPYRIHRVPEAARWSVEELLDLVELPAEHAGKYPHELSGGQARRVSIARAIALRPRLLVADEPTAGLDVSAAAAVLNLLRRLTADIGLAYLMVTHNLDTIGYATDRIAVMYLGRIVEEGPVDDVLRRPAHPYTHALVQAVPQPDPAAGGTEPPIIGEPPSPRHPPPGCRFHPRCPLATDRCRTETPEPLDLGGGRLAACHYAPDHLETPLV
ncbi:MAG TPA: ABC transporter ATP-binding protein [Streptosporangiaceae bacterium]|jgi:oligopeptide/dipeptide ABC transporter ATP-binding protein